MAYITDEDYGVQARTEIIKMLDGSEGNTAFRVAERMAIDQVKKNLSGRYDLTSIFAKEGDERDMFLVMLIIDMALYHIWAKKAPRMIPEMRKERYQDALDWLTAVGDGKRPTDLPLIASDEYKGEIRIKSVYTPNNNKF